MSLVSGTEVSFQSFRYLYFLLFCFVKLNILKIEEIFIRFNLIRTIFHVLVYESCFFDVGQSVVQNIELKTNLNLFTLTLLQYDSL